MPTNVRTHLLKYYIAVEHIRKENDMGVYIEGLEVPKTGSIRIQLYDDGTVWAFQGFKWERHEKKYTDLDFVRCGECKHKIQALSTEKGATGCKLISGTFYEDFFCKAGERRTDDTD